MVIGKARILFKAEGCVDCGVTYSPAWQLAERIKIIVGNRRSYIELHRCCACTAAKRTPAPNHNPAPNPQQERRAA